MHFNSKLDVTGVEYLVDKAEKKAAFNVRTFATAGPQVWNSVPPNLRLCGLSYI